MVEWRVQVEGRKCLVMPLAFLCHDHVTHWSCDIRQHRVCRNIAHINQAVVVLMSPSHVFARFDCTLHARCNLNTLTLYTEHHGSGDVWLRKCIWCVHVFFFFVFDVHVSFIAIKVHQSINFQAINQCNMRKARSCGSWTVSSLIINQQRHIKGSLCYCFYGFGPASFCIIVDACLAVYLHRNAICFSGRYQMHLLHVCQSGPLTVPSSRHQWWL